MSLLTTGKTDIERERDRWISRTGLMRFDGSAERFRKKSVVVLVHAVKAYRGRGGSAPFIRNVGANWTRVVNITPRTLYPQEATLGGVQELVSAFRREKNILASAGMKTADSPGRRVVTVLTELSYLIMVYSRAVFVNHMWVEALVGQLRHNPCIHLDSHDHGDTGIGSFITQARSRKILYEEFNNK